MPNMPRMCWVKGRTLRVLVSAVACLIFVSVPKTSFAQTRSEGGQDPRAAQSQVGPDQGVQLEGELEIVYQDFKDGHHRLLYSLKRSDGTRVPLQFVKEPPTHLLTGDHVRASGQLSGGSLILYSGSTSVTKTTAGDATGSTTSSIPLPYTFGGQYALIILVNFQDD